MFKAYFITCLVPFQIEESSYAIAQKDAAAVFASLAYDIQKLHETLCANRITLQWCTEAMILLKKMHAEFLMLFQRLKVPIISWNGTSKLLDEYMNESLNILEFCNLLKSAISDVNRHILKIDIAVRCMCDGGILAEIQEMDRQEMKLYSTLKWKIDDHFEVPMHKKKNKYSTTNIIFAIRGAITILCSILFCVICQPIPVEVGKEIYCELPQMKLFMDSIEDLAKCFTKKFNIAGENLSKKSNIAGENLSVSFLENAMIEKTIKDTRSQLKTQSLADREKLERIKATIRQELASVRTGLEVFESEVAKVFREVLEGRSNLMQQITSSGKT